MLRRLTDITVSLLALIILSPVFVMLLLINTVSTVGHPFFCQKRVGKHGRPFRMLKFRTMKRDAEQQGQLTIGRDKRVTSFGRFLRRFKFDEWPQLFNVLVGQMSLVGPRPEVFKYVSMYNEEQRSVLNWKPGLTDPASLRYINESELLATFDDPEQGYVSRVMPEKLRMNLEYLRSRTWASDMRVLMRTVARVIKSPS